MPALVCEATANPHFDDAWLGSVLAATWALRTGRVLRQDVPCDALTADELVTFWADPLLDYDPPVTTTAWTCGYSISASATKPGSSSASPWQDDRQP